MTEIHRIQNYNKGELPKVDYDILRVKGIDNPEDELQTFKDTLIAFLENKNLKDSSAKWEDLLPEKLVKFVDQLDEEDFSNDDMLYQIDWMIENLQRMRKWEWYSSNVTATGFEVVMTGIFRAIFIPLIHQQGIPLHNIFIQRGGDIFPTSTYADVMLYKKYDPDTFELTKR